MEPCQKRHMGIVSAIFRNSARHLKPINLSNPEVLHTMTRRCVNKTGTRVCCHVITWQKRHIKIIALAAEGVACDGTFLFLARQCLKDFLACNPYVLGNVFKQVFRHF